jgi:hypothetical protein
MSTKETAAVANGFDLADLDLVSAANEGVEVELVHPTNGEGLGIKVRVVGRDSDEFRRLSAAQARRRVQRMSKGGFRNKTQDVEELEAEGIELLAACTKGWTGMVMNKEVVPFSRDAAITIYTKYPWIREQVDTAIGDRSLFIKA